MTVAAPPPANGDGYTVKEILTQFVLPEIKALRKEASARAEEQDKRLEALTARTDALEGWRDKLLGAIALTLALVLPVVVPIILPLVTGGH